MADPNNNSSEKAHRATRISRSGSAELLPLDVQFSRSAGTLRNTNTKSDKKVDLDSVSFANNVGGIGSSKHISPKNYKNLDKDSKRVSVNFGHIKPKSSDAPRGSREDLGHSKAIGAIGKFFRGADLDDSQVFQAFNITPSEDLIYTETAVVYQNAKGKLFLSTNYLLFYTEELQVKMAIYDILDINKKGKSNLEIISVAGVLLFEKVNTVKMIKHITETYPDGWDNRINLFKCIADLDYERIETILDIKYKFPVNLSELDEEDRPPLHAAIKTHDARIIDPMLKYYKLHQHDINIQDKLGWSVLHTYFNSAAATESDDDLIFKLLDFPGINANIANRDNNTVLHYFCQKTKSSNAQEIAEHLLNMGADINKVNRRGESALHYAVLNSTVRIIIVKLLIAKGIKVNIQNNSDETALHYALHTRRKDLIKILLKASADVSIKSSHTGLTPLDMAREIGGDIAFIFNPAQKVFDFLNKVGLGHLCGKFLAEDFDLDIITKITPDIVDDIFYCLRVPLNQETKKKFLNAIYQLKKTRKEDEIDENPYIQSCAPPAKIEESFEEKLKKAKQSKQRVSLPSQDITTLQQLVSDKWALNYSELELLKKIGSGASGKVFKGLLHSKGEDQKVAIKILKAKPEQLVREFKDEFLILSAVQSDFVIKFFGATIEPKVCMVMEYCSFGSLYSILIDSTPCFELTWSFGLKMLFGISAGLHAFHSCNPQIFHRDIKSLNILVDENITPKLADFGEARFSNTPELDVMVGTVGWSCPEIFGEKPQKFTAKSDIYSMGMLFWEIVYRISQGTYSRPFSEYKELTKEIQILTASAEKQKRPTIPSKIHKDLRSLITQCWSHDPNDRPTAIVVLEKIEMLTRNLEQEPENWR